MFLTEASTVTANSLIEQASTATTGLLGIGTSIFNWALSNPIFVLGIIIMIIFVAIGVVKSLSHR